MLEITLILLVILAICAVQTNVLRRSIVYLCVFSLLCSFAYLLYQAPDVAIAEAVIGSTLSTIIYLVALNKYKVFRIYYVNDTEDSMIDKQIRSNFRRHLSNFALQKELELDIVITDKSLETIVDDYPYDVIVLHRRNNITFYGDKSNYHFDELINYISENSNIKFNYTYLLEDEGDALL